MVFKNVDTFISFTIELKKCARCTQISGENVKCKLIKFSLEYPNKKLVRQTKPVSHVYYLDGTIFSTVIELFLALPLVLSLVFFELDVSDVMGVPGFMFSVLIPVLSTIICLTLNCIPEKRKKVTKYKRYYFRNSRYVSRT